MRVLTLLMAGAALLLSVLTYMRTEEVADRVYSVQQAQDSDTQYRNRVLSLGQQLERLIGRQAEAPKPKAAQQ